MHFGVVADGFLLLQQVAQQKSRCVIRVMLINFSSSAFFSNRVLNRWDALHQSAVDAPSISAFKQTLVKVRNNWMGLFID